LLIVCLTTKSGSVRGGACEGKECPAFLNEFGKGTGEGSSNCPKGKRKNNNKED